MKNKEDRMKKIICAFTAAFIAANVQIPPITAGAAFDKTVFNLDFEGEAVSAEVIDSSLSVAEVYDVTNTWIDKSVYSENRLKTTNAGGNTIDAGKGSYKIVRDYFGREENALEISGYDGGTDGGSDGNKLAITNLLGFNKSFASYESMDCGENGSFCISFDFATSDFSVQLGLRMVRTLVLNEGASAVSEGLPYGKNLFVLNRDKSISVFGDRISAEELGELETDTWYHAEIIVNAKNEMGFRLNGIVKRQMQPLSAGFSGSVRGLATSINIPVNYGATGGSKDSKRYLDNFCYAFSKTDGAEKIEDDKTEVWFAAGDNDIEFASSDDKRIEVAASSPHGIESVTLYVDGVALDTKYEAPYIFDLNSLSVGSVNVYAEGTDLSGNTVATVPITINVNLSVPLPLWKEDFTSYKSGDKTAGDNIELYNRLGYLENGEISDNYGNSVLMKMKDSANSSTDATGALMLISNKQYSSRHIRFEADVYTPDVTYDYRICARQKGLPEKNVIIIGKSGISSPDGITYPYGESEWYHISADIDPASKLYSVFVRGENDEETTVLASGKIIRADFSQLDEIRIYGPSAPPASSLGIDNVSVSAVESYSIKDVRGKNDSGREEIDYTSDELKLYINGSVAADSVVPEMFSVESGNASAHPAKVTYDKNEKCFILSLKQKLEYGENYVLRTAPELPASGGAELGASMSISFKTSQAPFWADIKNADSGEVHISLHNNTDEEKKAYMIVSCYEKNSFSGMTVKEVTVGAAETKNAVVSAENYLPGCEIHAFVWDSIVKPSLISKTVLIK